MGQAHRTAAYSNVGGSVSVGGENLYELFKAQEKAKGNAVRPIQAYSLYVDTDCTVSINGDTDSIPVFTTTGLSGNGEIWSFVLNEPNITYSFVAEY